MDISALMNLAKGKKAELAARGNFSNIVKPPAGKSRWRILPGWRENEPFQFFHDFGQHYIKDKDGNIVIVYVCEESTFGKECPVCDRLNAMIRSTKDEEALKMLKEMKGRQIHLVNAVRLDGGDADPKKPVLLQLVGSLLQSYFSVMEEYLADDINILDAKQGRNITIERTGQSINTKYSLTVAPSNSPVNEEALTRLIDIDAFIESEALKGRQKGLALFDSTTRQVLSAAGSSSSYLVDPKAARLMPPKVNKVIEQEDEDGETMVEERPAEKVVSKASKAAPVDSDDADDYRAAPTVKTATRPSKPVAEDKVYDEDELAKILGELDDE